MIQSKTVSLSGQMAVLEKRIGIAMETMQVDIRAKKPQSS